MNRFEFQLNLSPEQWLAYYRGTLRHVMVRAKGGQLVQFPASRLQQFVAPDGIRGWFVLSCDANLKCIEVSRLEDSD